MADVLKKIVSDLYEGKNKEVAELVQHFFNQCSLWY